MMFYKALAPGSIGHSLAFLDAAEVTKRHGFEGYWFEASLDFAGDTGRTAEKLQEYGLRPAGFSLPVEFRKGEQEFREGIAKLPTYLDFARKVGIDRCITWIIPFHDHLSYQENFEQHRRRLGVAANMLKDHSMLLGLEFIGPKTLRKNARHEFIHTLDGMLELCGAIGTMNCGILADAYHWHMAGQKFEDFDKLAVPNGIVCAHVMDAPPNVTDGEQEDLVRRLPGTTGVINIAEFFAGLEKAGFEGPVLAEPFERFLSMIPFERAVNIVSTSMARVWPA